MGCVFWPCPALSHGHSLSGWWIAGLAQPWSCSWGSSEERPGCRLLQSLCSPTQGRKPHLWCYVPLTTAGGERTEVPAGVGRVYPLIISEEWAHSKVVVLVHPCRGVQLNMDPKGQGQGEGSLTCISANWSLSRYLKPIALLKCGLLLPDFLCRQEREVINLPMIAVLRKGSHLAACCIIQQERCGFRGQYCPHPWRRVQAMAWPLCQHVY